MIDNAFDALADRNRRRLLVGLLHYDPQYVSELSGVSREIADTNEELLRFHHVHLPRLAACGFIEWHRDAHVVMKGP